MDHSPPGSSVHGILQARILEWVAMPSSRGSSQLRDQTLISCFLHGQVGSLPLPHLSVYMGTTSFSKFAWLHLAFIQGQHLYMLLLTERNLKRIFPLREKMQKKKVVFCVCSAAASAEEGLSQSRVRGTASFCALNYTQCLRIKLPELWVIYEHLCFIWVYLVHPSASCVLKDFFFFSLYAIWYGKFDGNLVLPEWEGNLYHGKWLSRQSIALWAVPTITLSWP